METQKASFVFPTESWTPDTLEQAQMHMQLQILCILQNICIIFEKDVHQNWEKKTPL